MQPAQLEQELSAIPDLTARRRRWLDLIRTATAPSAPSAPSQTAAPASDHDSEVAAYLWHYPTTLTHLEPQAQRQWQRDAQTRFNLRRDNHPEFDTATEVQKRKLACKNRIREAWGIEVEDILKDNLAAGAGGLGRSTLEILAMIAEENQLEQAESVLLNVITQRSASEPHIGRSRKQKLTRQDVMETRSRLKERNQEASNTELRLDALGNMSGRRKRKRAASAVDSGVHSKDDANPTRGSTAPLADLPTPGASTSGTSHASHSPLGTDDGDVTDKSPEIGRHRQESLLDLSNSLGGDGDPLAMDLSGLSAGDSNPTPKEQDDTSGGLLQDTDALQDGLDGSLDIGFDGPDGNTRLSGECSSTRLSAFNLSSTPTISTMPLREADEAVRKLAQEQYNWFFQRLKAIEELQRSNISRADNEIARVNALIVDKDHEAADCHSKLEQAYEALDTAETEERNAEAECVKHEPLRALCDSNNFSDAIRHALTQTEEELDNLDQTRQDAMKVTDNARAEMDSCEDTAKQCQQALGRLRQELGAAEKLLDRCKSTGSVLQGSSDEILSLCLGPRFPHDDES